MLHVASAPSGGAMAVWESSFVQLFSSTFVGNAAHADGGAVTLGGTGLPYARIIDSLLLGNAAGTLHTR